MSQQRVETPNYFLGHLMNAPTGYDSKSTFYATRYRQGGRVVFSLDLSLTQIADLLPAPDPSKQAEGNRQVKESHARAFGEYVRNTDNWVSPALVLRAPDIFEFEVREKIAGTEFGILSFPVMARTDLRILDGQHRTLGIHLAIKEISADLEKARNHLSNAKKTDAIPQVIQQHQAQIEKLNGQRTRLSQDRTSIQIFIEDEQVAYKQMFYDIAENALGITSSVKARFDSRKVVNRALDGVMKHSLFKNRVDMEQDRISKGNKNLLGAKQVAEIIRTLEVGIDGRVGKRLEDELDEGTLVEKANNFLDVLIQSFPPLESLVEEELSSQDLRNSSLLGSTVMLRVLAGVYSELTKAAGQDDDDVVEFFQKLAPWMDGPVQQNSPWITHVITNLGDTVFSVGALAPRSRRQDLKTLHDRMVEWGKNCPSWLS
jgi:DNA-sulfur modification-associated